MSSTPFCYSLATEETVESVQQTALRDSLQVNLARYRIASRPNLRKTNNKKMGWKDCGAVSFEMRLPSRLFGEFLKTRSSIGSETLHVF